MNARVAILFLGTSLLFGRVVHADQDVWLDFNAGWLANLNVAAASAGVAAFDALEVTTMEDEIASLFVDAFDGYTVNIMTTTPGGLHERVDFGALTTDGNLLGSATFDFRNSSHGTQDVYVRNFDFFLESGDSRPDQLTELATSIAGTAIHEVGHAFGLRHVHAFGDPRITPANYGDTQGFQNDHFMATGSTGLTEPRRELPRTFSSWSRLHLEAASRLSDTPLTPFLELFVGDVGDSLADAAELTLQEAPLADGAAALGVASLADDFDVDLFQVSLAQSSLVTADLWTGGIFDGTLRLLDHAGVELAMADDIVYSANAFGVGTTFSDDPFLLNIPVPAGDYFLEVAANGAVPVGFGNYDLTLGVFAVPEPTPWCLWSLVALLAATARARSRPAQGCQSGQLR